MGGFGSGRPSSSRKPTAESLWRLDLARLRRDGSLRSGAASAISWSCRGEATGSIGAIARADALQLMYRVGSRDTGYDVDEIVRLVRTKPRFGGERVWFACPGCGRRCRVLFGGARFRCRTCSGLRYGSHAQARACAAWGVRCPTGLNARLPNVYGAQWPGPGYARPARRGLPGQATPGPVMPPAAIPRPCVIKVKSRVARNCGTVPDFLVRPPRASSTRYLDRLAREGSASCNRGQGVTALAPICCLYRGAGCRAQCRLSRAWPTASGRHDDYRVC